MKLHCATYKLTKLHTISKQVSTSNDDKGRECNKRTLAGLKLYSYLFINTYSPHIDL